MNSTQSVLSLSFWTFLSAVNWSQPVFAGFVDEPPQHEVRWDGAGMKGSDSGDGLFNAVGTPQPPGPSRAPYPETEQPCHIVCGPNPQGYELHYFCERREGRLLQAGLLVKLFPICRRRDEINCVSQGENRARFTIRGTAFSRGSGWYQGENLTEMSCHGE